MSNPLAPPWLVVPDDANALPASVWSLNTRRGDDGEVTIAGVPVSAIAEEFGTPVYVMDEADVRARAARIRGAFDRELARVGSTAKVYYAGKAFLSTEVARWVSQEGLNIDVASGGELAVALAAGVDPGRLGMHGNNKSQRELDRAIGAGIGAVVIDSWGEIEQVARTAERLDRVQSVRLRINSGVHASTHEYLATAREDQKFGVPLADAPAHVERIRSFDALEFAGLHSHIGSQIFDSDGFAEAARRLFELHARLLAGGPVPELNLGGGFGIAYTTADDPLAIDELAARFADIVAEGAREAGVPVPVIAVEPGRSIVGPSTTTVYTVGTIKDVLVDGAATRKYVSVDGGMSDNIRTALYKADYSARLLNRASDAAPALIRVAGKHCESGDIVVDSDYVPGDVRSGDLLGVPATGAYGWAMGSNYNYLPRPPVVAVRDGAARVIVRGETEDDLLRRDAGL
ncbi:MAG TPA: diaminopimelate decarboxylase [Rhodoglobus sp.]|nr:diaminopimelate decarboxylase [Rhodoglobus sp.]